MPGGRCPFLYEADGEKSTYPTAPSDQGMACMTGRTELETAYLAGAVDADGFLSIQRTKRRIRSGTTSTYYIAKVGFAGTISQEVHLILKERFGGNIYESTPKNPRHKPVSYYQASGPQAYKAAVALRPYLRMKRQQAVLICEFVPMCAR